MSSEQEDQSTPIRIELISGVEGDCIGINDYRVAGPKPWGGGSVKQLWTTTKEDVLMAFLTPDDKHRWLSKQLTIISVNERDQLLFSLDQKQEEIERLRAALIEIRDTDPGCACEHDTEDCCARVKVDCPRCTAALALNPISEPQENESCNR